MRASTKQVMMALLAFIIISTTIYAVCSVSKTESIDLDASIRIGETALTITNINDFDWQDVWVQINPGIISSGYGYETDIMYAGQTYTVFYPEFTDGALRFDPYIYEVQQVTIYCDNNDDGLYEGVGSWLAR